MAGFTIGSRETALLYDIIEATRLPASVPLPWLVLDKLRRLLDADAIQFSCLDSGVQRVVFQQTLDPSGDRGCESETACEAEGNPFWRQYWGPLGCGHPDRSGDYRYVGRVSDRMSTRQRREMLASREDPGPSWGMRYLEACLPGRSPGRYFRVGAYRHGGDFSDRHVFYMQLLQPHLERAFWAGSAARRDAPVLTARQLEVLRLVRAGLTNGQIARRVGVSEGTVHVHLTNVYGRLGVQSRMAAVQAVFEAAENWSGGELSGPTSQG
jgi:DNA-binding CsgD family transcriptional regulator